MIKLLIMVFAFLLPNIGAALECATSRCYTDSYSSPTPESLPELSRVVSIYENISRTIGSKQAKRSRLLVIESDGYPWAVALSDNTVVLTSGAIKKMYHNSEQELGDARAAFILGHELSHLETEDLFHHRAFVANEKEPSILKIWRQRPDDELRADLRGFTYATVAGYETNRLFEKSNDFFLDWLPDTDSLSDSTHPDNATRKQYLIEGFESILHNVPYYRFATVLAHFGHYRDAQHLLEEFLNHVETEEAFSNLGYVHLQQAREEMHVKMAYKYWIPTLLEPASGLDIPRERGLFEQALPAAALHHLEKAEQYLEQAISMDDGQLVSHINLAATYLYMPDKIHHAFAAIEDAKRTQLGSVPAVRQQLESIDQLININVHLDTADRWPSARDKLEQLASDPAAADNLLYNFARMLDDRGRDDTAMEYWNKLYGRLDSLPNPYQAQVCFRLKMEQCNSENYPVPLQIKHSRFDKDVRYPEVKQYLTENWSANSPPSKLLPDLKAQVYLNEHGDSLLALDDHVEMMMIRDMPAEFSELSALQNKFGNPTVSLPLKGGQILSFGGKWAALVEKNQVVEIWVSDLFSGDNAKAALK